jgi:hypothetical protein
MGHLEQKETRMEKKHWTFAAAAVAGAAFALLAAPAHAGGASVQLHIGVPGYYAAPSYGYAAPSYGYAAQHPGYVYSQPGYVVAQPVYAQPAWGYGARPYRRDSDRDGIPNRWDRDRDNDGVSNRWDRDRDGDGVPNRWDRRPDNGRRY